MSEVITKLIKENNKLYIETYKDNIKWCAYIKIHPNNTLKKYICEFTFNNILISQSTIQKYIGSKIIKKNQIQYEDYYDKLDDNIKDPQDKLGKYDIIHLTELVFTLDCMNKIGMFIGEIYDIRYKENQRLEHSGGHT